MKSTNIIDIEVVLLVRNNYSSDPPETRVAATTLMHTRERPFQGLTQILGKAEISHKQGEILAAWIFIMESVYAAGRQKCLTCPNSHTETRPDSCEEDSPFDFLLMHRARLKRTL
jgi:hypothetical protein